MRMTTILTLTLMAAGCSNGPAPTNPVAAPPVVLKPELLTPLQMAAKPDAALSVPDAMTKSDGETVTVTGVTPPPKVRPFNPSVAAFMLIDPADAKRPEVAEEFDCDDAATCPRCRKLLDKLAVRVELVNADGQVVPSSLEGFANLQPGTPVTVTGTVRRDGKDKKLVRVVATQFYPG